MSIRRGLAALLAAATLISASWGAAVSAEYGQIARQIAAAQRESFGTDTLLSRQDVLPAGQSPVADWLALALARAGIEDDYDGYLASLRDYVENAYREKGGLSDRKATEWHRIALTVTALGGDATRFGVRPDGSAIDLIADGCYNCIVEGGLGVQGLNGWIFALLALDAGAYQVPQDARYTREMMLAQIVSAQLPDGGFSLAGGAMDVDVTAMALQALSPYQAQCGEVIDRALAALSAAQTAQGSFASRGTPNAESVCQVILALCALGIDPGADARFCKSGGDPVTALLSFRLADGSFAHTDSADAMACEQAMQAFAALERLAQGRNGLFAMGDAAAAQTGAGGRGAARLIPAALVCLAGAGAAIVMCKRKRRSRSDG